MYVEEGLAYIVMPLSVRQLEEVLGMVEDKDRVVCVSDETLALTEITAVDFGSGRDVKLYINGEVVEA